MSDKTSDKLIQCPFCGGEARLHIVPPFNYEISNIMYINGGAFVECVECGCVISADGAEQAIAAWNTRKPMERILERLEEQKKQYKRREKEHEGKNITVKLSEKYYGKACSYGHAIEIVKEEM